MDALWFGCVPVIISDYYDLPLQGLIDWAEIAVFVKESKVPVYWYYLYSVKKESVKLTAEPDWS